MLVLFAALVVAAACNDGGADEVAPGREGEPGASRSEAAQAIDDWRKAERVSAVVVGVDSPTLGTIIMPSGTLSRDAATPVENSDQFRIGSITKTFTAALILRLVDEGRLSLDDTVAQHLPSLPVPASSDITIRSLLANRTGLRDYEEAPGFFDAVARDLDRTWTPAEVVSLFGSAAPAFAPGQEYAYSSTNFLVLALIAEAVTGQSYEGLLSTHFLQPLNLTTTTPMERRVGEGRFVHGYTRKYARFFGDNEDVNDVPQAAIETISGASGAMISSAPDLLTWGRALYAGTVLAPDTRAQMLTFDEEISPYGLGAFKFDTQQGAAVGHGGEYLGFTSTLMYFPAEDMVVTVLANADDIPLEPLVERVLDLLLGSGQRGTASLIEALGGEDAAARREAALELGKVSFDTDVAIAALARALKDDDAPEVRAAAALALGIVGRAALDEASAILREALGDPDTTVRDAAARAIDVLTDVAGS